MARRLVDQLIRNVVPGTHPIELVDYTVATKAIDESYHQVRHWIISRLPGATIYGPSQFGKSRAIEAIVKKLRTDPDINATIRFVNVSFDTKITTGKVFYYWLLKQLRYSHTPIRPNDDCKFLLTEYLCTLASERYNHVVLVFDEAQNFYTPHYKWLIDIKNEMTLQHHQLTVIQVGQHQLQENRQGYIEDNQAQIIGRFMVLCHQFRGIRNVEDIRICLNSYDQDNQFPPSSGVMYTEFFFPDAFEAGWRLSHHADEFWAAFKTLHQSVGKRTIHDIPMAYFTRTVEYLLKTYRNRLPYPPFDEPTIREAIISSGFLQNVLVINEMVPRNQVAQGD